MKIRSHLTSCRYVMRSRYFLVIRLNVPPLYDLMNREIEKTKMNIDLLLPGVPDEKDACVQRVIDVMQTKRGIDKVHLVTESGDGKARLCFHYDPDQILINEVEDLARDAGAQITEKYGHLLLQVKGIRHPRHARIVESDIRRWEGILSASVSGTGFIQLEFQKEILSVRVLKEKIRGLGLRIISSDDFEPHDSGQTGHEAHGPDHGHGHPHLSFLGEKTELIFAISSGIFLGLGFGLSFLTTVSPGIPIGFYVLAYIAGGFFTSIEAVSGISKGRFEIDFLMIVAAIGAAFLGVWAEGALLLFLFSLGHSLEHFALERARKNIAALSDLYPRTALVKTPDGLREVLVEDLQVGQHILVRPNSIIGADGVVLQGNSSVNQSAITGESMPVEKIPFTEDLSQFRDFSLIDEQHRVFAGTINGSKTIEVYIGKLTADSTLSRLIRMVNEAQTQKSQTQNFTDRIERYYVPIVLGLVTVLLFAFVIKDESFGDSFYRAMAVLIAASPCALAISTPSAVLSGVARAARGGVLIKGGKPLEELGGISAIAFDKTGTLTRGKPELSGVFPLNNETEASLLELVVAVEKLSDHPLAAAIVRGGEERLGRKVDPAENLRAIVARGIEARVGSDKVYVGNIALFTEKSISAGEAIHAKVQELEEAGFTTMLVSRAGRLAGILTLRDVARQEAAEALAQIRKYGIRHIVMLTGDNQSVANSIAREVGITEAFGGLLPEQKVDAVLDLRSRYGKVAMVGDGVNDAPAMARSNVGIAMGAAGSPLALETADVALMADNLSNLPFALGLSAQSRKVIRQNLVISIGMVVILIPLTMAGLSIAPAVVGHEGSTMIVVLNALRLLAYKKK